MPLMKADMAMKELLMENGFSLFFPEDVVEKTERIRIPSHAEEIDNRKD